MASFDDEIGRFSKAPLRGQENQVARYMQELFVTRGRSIPVVMRFVGYVGTAVGAGAALWAFGDKIFGGH